MLQDHKKLYEISFIRKAGEDPIITHVAACDIDEAKELIQLKYKVLKILEVFPV